MTIDVSILHVESNSYLALDADSAPCLSSERFPWTLNATADEVSNYTFNSLFLSNFWSLVAKSGTLGTEFGQTDALAMKLPDADPSRNFVFTPQGTNNPSAGHPLQVSEGGHRRNLNVAGGAPVFGDDDWTSGCGWIVAPF